MYVLSIRLEILKVAYKDYLIQSEQTRDIFHQSYFVPTYLLLL